MQILSEENKIIWINSIGMRRPNINKSDLSRIITKVKGWFKGATHISDNFIHFSPIVLPFPGSKICRLINKYLLIFLINYYRKKLDMREIQLWTFMPNIVEIIGALDEKLLVYYCVDEWSKFSFMDGELLRSMEIELMKKADLVVTTADFLYKDKIQFNSNTKLLTHGVDRQFFAEALDDATEVAVELTGLKGPVLGFFGLIHEWIDIELIAYTAKTRPDWQIVLIGNVLVDVSVLKDLDNVHLLGKKAYADLAGYCKGFDLGLIPFMVNELTLNVNPIKLREYLAAGLPVVSTALPECEKYSEFIRIAGSKEEFVELVELELSNDSREKRQERSAQMKSETWRGKVEELSEMVTALVD